MTTEATSVVELTAAQEQAQDDHTQLRELFRTLSDTITRLQLANLAGVQYDGARDLYQVFGYKRLLTDEHMRVKYVRQDIASRIVDAPPTAIWSNPPEIVAPFSAEWESLANDHDLYLSMWRADRISRMSRYALLLFGFGDGKKLEQAVGKVKEITYVRAIGSQFVKSIEYDQDDRSPRFGLPKLYKISVDDPKAKAATFGTGSNATIRSLRELTVHHSRVVHIADNTLENPVIGNPILERCFNLLDDLLKVAGGTAETYWMTSNRGLHADVDKEMTLTPEDATDLEDEIEEYQHQLRRVIRTRGVAINAMKGESPSPQQVFDMIIALLSGVTGILKRILIGASGSVGIRAGQSELGRTHR